jgi:D-apiose dehydrogenase
VKKLKGVCIGAGYFSQFQFDAWSRIPEVEVVALCDQDPAKANAMADTYSIAGRYTDYRQMLEQEKPDFVDVITPPSTHPTIVAFAAQAGVHVICQKPLAETFAEAEEMVREVGKTGIRFMVHENYRFQPWHRQIKKLLTEGAIGKLHSFHFRCRMGDGWGEDAYLNRQAYFRHMPRLFMHETGVHFIDTFRFLVGDIQSVQAHLRRLNPVIKGEDAAFVVFTFENGVLGVLDANRYNESNYPDPRYTFGEFRLEGDGGAIRLEADGSIYVKKLGEEEIEHEYFHRNHGFGADCCYFTQRHFVEKLLQGEPFETEGEDYLKTLRVLEEVYRSDQEKRPMQTSA